MSHRDLSRYLQVAIAAAAMTAVAGCSTQPPRTDAERAADEDLAARVDEALQHDPAIYARHIDVQATRGVVRLSGLVWSSTDLYEAKRVAATVAGVTIVQDQLELVVGGRTGAR